jgi:SAM-dependent methyltransferase
MNKEIIEFGKRMDAAEDKAMLVDYAEHATSVLDLGAGTGKISRDIAEKWGAHVDAVDIQFKDNCQNSDSVTYYGMGINEFLANYPDKKYDCIVLSAILHELSDEYIEEMLAKLQNVMKANCRILVREPFYDEALGPVLVQDLNKYVDLVKDHLPAGKAIEFALTPKLNSGNCLCIEDLIGIDWINLSFTISYGDQAWEREKHELRYARSLDWCKRVFDMPKRPFTGFQALPVLDKTYRRHFINANIPAEAFDLIQYTGMLVIIDYSIIE